MFQAAMTRLSNLPDSQAHQALHSHIHRHSLVHWSSKQPRMEKEVPQQNFGTPHLLHLFTGNHPNKHVQARMQASALSHHSLGMACTCS
jgi:hypothetical protein